MISHTRHSVTADSLPHLFRPEEVAKALGCSAWWVKEQARRRRIPFTRAGGAYRFTADHFAEIVRAFEERPVRTAEPATAELGATARPRRPPEQTPAIRLRARRPRRALLGESPAA